MKMNIKRLRQIIKESLLVEATCPACGDKDAYVGMNDIECPNSKCSHFSQKQADDVRPSSSGRYAACMYDAESEDGRWFAKGSKAKCKAAARKMAVLLDVDVIAVEEIVDDPFEADGQPYVVDLNDEEHAPLENLSAIKTVVVAPGDSYNSGSSIMFDGSEGIDDSEPTGFQPVKPTRFKAGDKLIIAVFHANNPGGWTVSDVNMTFTEYWQCGTIDNTFPDP